MKPLTSPTPLDLGETLQALYHNARILHEKFGYDQFQAGEMTLKKNVLGFLSDFEKTDGQGLERKRKDELPTTFIVRHLIEEGVSHNDIMAAWSVPHATFYRIKKVAMSTGQFQSATG